MGLKAMVADLKEIPEALRGLYKESADGKEFILEVDDKDYGGKLTEARNNWRELTKAKKDLEAKMAQFEGIDPAKYAEMVGQVAELDKLADKDLIKAGKFDEVVAKRLQSVQTDYEKKLVEERKARQRDQELLGTLSGKYSKVMIDTQVSQAVLDVAQPRPGAMNDILNRARNTWKLSEDDSLNANDLYDEKGAPMTVKQWAQKLVTDAPFLFEGGSGGGATGGKKKSAAGGPKFVANDPLAIGRNLAAIAKGEASVAIDRGEGAE